MRTGAKTTSTTNKTIKRFPPMYNFPVHKNDGPTISLISQLVNFIEVNQLR